MVIIIAAQFTFVQANGHPCLFQIFQISSNGFPIAWNIDIIQISGDMCLRNRVFF